MRFLVCYLLKYTPTFTSGRSYAHNDLNIMQRHSKVSTFLCEHSNIFISSSLSSSSSSSSSSMLQLQRAPDLLSSYTARSVSLQGRGVNLCTQLTRWRTRRMVMQFDLWTSGLSISCQGTPRGINYAKNLEDIEYTAYFTCT